MNNPHPEIEVLFVSANHQDAEQCFNSLNSSGHFENFFKIIPKYYIPGKSEYKLEARENMVVVFHADNRNDFDTIKNDIKHFSSSLYRCLFSNKDEAFNWVKELNDHGLRVLIGMKEDSINHFKDLVIFFLKAHGGWKEGHIPEHKEHHKTSLHTKEQKTDIKTDVNPEISAQNIQQGFKVNPLETQSKDETKEHQGGI